MKFHLRTLELFGQPDLPLDPERETVTVMSASDLGVGLPAAVAEWYRVPERSDLWRWYSGCHQPAAWRKDGDNCMHRPHPADEDDYREWWVNPAVCHDSAGWIKAPILPLMCENQGCWEWGVVLDGTANPPAVISFDSGDTWDTCAGSFSEYVYAIIFDSSLYHPDGVHRSFRIEDCLRGERRKALHEAFRVEPTTRGAGTISGVFTERFSSPEQRFSIFNFDGDRSSYWELWSATPAGLADLIDRLARIIPLVRGHVQDQALSFYIPDGGTDDKVGGGDEFPF